MKKIAIFLTIMIFNSLSRAGGVPAFSDEQSKHLTCKGEKIEISARVSRDLTEATLSELFRQAVSPELKLKDVDLIEFLIQGGLMVDSGMKDWSTKEGPSELRVLLDASSEAKRAHGVFLDGRIFFQPSAQLVSSQNPTVFAVFESQERRKGLQIRAEADSDSSLTFSLQTILSEVRRCVETKTVPNPWVLGETMERCERFIVVEEMVTIPEISDSFSINQCQFK